MFLNQHAMRNVTACCIQVFSFGLDMALCFQSLVKKDREDPNDAAMDEFYDKLVIAYKDPALQPIESPSNTSTLRTPLMSP